MAKQVELPSDKSSDQLDGKFDESFIPTAKHRTIVKDENLDKDESSKVFDVSAKYNQELTGLTLEDTLKERRGVIKQKDYSILGEINPTEYDNNMPETAKILPETIEQQQPHNLDEVRKLSITSQL